MTATFFLIIIFISGDGQTMTTVPMQTAELCEQAEARSQKLEGVLSKVRTLCVRASQ